MNVVPLQLKGISQFIGNDDLALLELVTDDGLKQLAVVCEGTMIRQVGLRLSDVPIRHKLLPEVLWTALGGEKKENMSVLFADFHEGEYIVFLCDEEIGKRWPIRASDAVLLATVAKLPMVAEQRVMERCAAPVDTSGKGVVMPMALLPTELLRKELEKAIAREDYEKASHLRDELKKRDSQPS